MMPINTVDGVSGVGGGLPPDLTKEFGKVGSAAEHQKLEKEEGPSDGSGVIHITAQELERLQKEHHQSPDAAVLGTPTGTEIDPYAGLEVAGKEQEKIEGLERLGDAAQESWVELQEDRKATTVTPASEAAESQAVPSHEARDPSEPPSEQGPDL